MIRKFKLPDNGIPIRVGDTGFIYKDVYHPIEWYAGEPYRPRVETLVLAKMGTDSIFMEKKEGNRYRIPGGSIDSDSTFDKQAENETNEEALLKISDIAFANVVYHQEMDKDYIAKGGDSCIPYVGSITHVYTAYWTGDIIDKSTIEEKDLDEDMAKNGKFYPIRSVIEILREDHIKALINSGRIRDKSVESLLYSRLNTLMVEQPPSTIFETQVTPGQMETKYIYHGSTHDFDVFHPMSLDLGNGEQEPGWSTFCFREYTLARRFALMRLIQGYLDGNKDPMHKCGWDLKKNKPYLHHTVYAEVLNAIRHETFYIYTIDAGPLNLGIGNDERFPEVTFREDNVLPYKKDVLFADEETVREDIEIIRESPDVYEKKQMDDIANLNRGWVTCMLNRDYSGDSAVAKLTKAVSDGKLKPGDDVTAYMNEHGIALKDISFLERILDVRSVEESYDLSDEFEETIILGDHKVLHTSEWKHGDNVDIPEDCWWDNEAMLPKKLQDNYRIIHKGFLYEIYNGGTLTPMGQYEIVSWDDDQIPNPVYFLQMFVREDYRRLGVGSVIAGYVTRYQKKKGIDNLNTLVANRIWEITGIRNWIRTFTRSGVRHTKNEVIVKINKVGDDFEDSPEERLNRIDQAVGKHRDKLIEYLGESCEQNLSNLNWYYAEVARPGFNPKIAGGWDEELYSKEIDHAIKQAFMSAVASNKELLKEKKLTMYMYTAGEELSAIYLGKVTMYYYGLEDNGYIPKFDWEWAEQEDFSDAFLSNLKEEVHPALMESVLMENAVIPQENLEINLNKWAPGTPLWITGASGDGKTTLAKEYKKKKNAIIISTDILLIRLDADNEEAFKNRMEKITKDKIHSDGETWGIEYVEAHPELPYGIKYKDLSNGSVSKPYFTDFFNWIMIAAKTDPKYNKRYVIVEGSDITEMDPNILVEQPLIIIGGSVVRTICRRIKRKMQKGKSLIPAVIDQLGKYNIIMRLVRNKDRLRKEVSDIYFASEAVDISADIVDMTDVDEDGTVTEGVASNLLEPIFIICTFTGTRFGKVVTKIQHSKFSHSGISLDSKMKKIYTFNIHSKKTGGAGIESIDEYDNVYTGEPGDICVMCFFVPPSVKERIKQAIEYVFSNMEKTRYAFGNLLNILANRAVETKDSLQMVCSQFVDYCLKTANIDLTKKSSNLVSPNDFASVPKKNPKVFLLFDGKKSGYKAAQIDKKIDYILSTKDEDEINVVEEETLLESRISFETVEENVTFNKDNTIYNIDKFESGESNILLVTGLSGSGKSTLGEEMARKYGATLIGLDNFEFCYEFPTDEDLRKYAGEVFYEYLNARKPLWNKLKNKELSSKQMCTEISLFTRYCISWCKRHKESKWVIEGVQIYSFLDGNEARKYPLIIMGTSMKNSILQRFKRNSGGGRIEWGKEIKNDIFNLIQWYWGEEKYLKSFEREAEYVSESVLPDGFVLPEQGDLDQYMGLADLDEAREAIPDEIMEGWLTALMEAKKDKTDDEGLPSLGKDDKTEDYSKDAEGSMEEDPEETGDEPQFDNDGDESTDYTEDAGESDDDENPEETEPDGQSEEPATGEDDTNDLDAGGTDYTQNTGNTDDGESSGEEPSDTEPEPKNDTQSGNNGVKNYTLLTDFESLYRLASEISDTIEPIIMEKPIQNKVLTQVRSNLSAIKSAIMNFITIHFKATDYAFNLYYYEIFMGLLSKNVKILMKNREFSSKESERKRKNDKE